MRQPLPDGALLGSSTMLDLTIASLNKLKGIVLRQSPKVNIDSSVFLASTNPKEGDPCFVISTFNRILPDVLEVEIYKGSYGELDFLVGQNGSLTNISGDAATRKYLVRISFPSNMNCCYVASQMRGRSQAGTDLFSQISFELHKSAVKLVNQHELTKIHDWYRFVSEPKADQDRFNAALGKAEVESFKLVKSVIRSNGHRAQEKYVMEYSKPALSAKKAGLDILGKLSHKAGQNSSYPPAINEIAAIFPSWSAASSTNWDDGLITFTENGKSTTISAHAIAELFVYPLGEKASLRDLWSEANSRLAIIGKVDGIIIPSIV
jgi:hypothetical protein